MNFTQYLPYIGAVGLGLVALYQLLTGDTTDAVRSASLAAGLLGIHLNPTVLVPKVTTVVVDAPTIHSRPDIDTPPAK